MPDDMMSGGPGPGTSACAIGPVAGNGCTHEGGGSSFTFTINDDGSACRGGICSGKSLTINNFSARKNEDGTWEITALPGQTPADDMMASTPSSGFGLLNDASITTGLSNAIAQAAVNEPVAGSITQSSDGTNAVSDDRVGVDVTFENGQLMYDVSYDGRSIVSTGRGQAAEDAELILDQPKGTELFERIQNGVEFYRSLRANEAETGSVAGDLWVDVYTDYEGENDTDYLAGGIWVFAPDDATSLADYEFGAFGDGNDPFAQSALPALTGTATYHGEATGVNSNMEEGRNWFFDATATLTANFDGGANNLGTIEGSIHDFEIYGVRELGDDFDVQEVDATVNLHTANIGDTEAGFFTGNTSLIGDDDIGTGKWGGGFFGTGESDGKPGSVGGTFGGATSSGDQSFLGIFGAHKQ